MNSDYKELIEYLDQKFAIIDQRFGAMPGLVITKEEGQEIKEEISSLKENIQALTVSVDRLVKAMEDMHKEYVAMKHRIDRHETWLKQIAEKVGMKLEY